MSSPGPVFIRRALCALASALALYALPFAQASQAAGPAAGAPLPPTEETRALWVLRTSLTSPDRISALVRAARDHGFNTLFVQVRGRGDSYFRGGIEPRAADLARQPERFDPLATVLDEAHAAELHVHAWINVNLVSSAADLPAAREHLVYRHPLWLMVPRDIAQEMAAIDPDSPAYVGTLARWTRAQSAGIEGLYASPILPAAAEYTEAVVADIARRYPLDGVHFDYARYPTDRFDYSSGAIAEFRASVLPRLSVAERRTLDRDQTIDLFAYPDALPDAWRAFRVARMTALMTRLHDTVKRVRPEAVVSVAAAPDMREALERRLQDWGGWLTRGIVDALCPMAYTPEPARFAEQIAAAREAAGDRPVWAGIGAYRLSPAQTVENIQTARRLGAAGVILFSYDSLTDPHQTTPDYLALVGRAAFTTSATAAGSR